MAVTGFCVSQASSLSLRRLVRLSHSIVLYESQEGGRTQDHAKSSVGSEDDPVSTRVGLRHVLLVEDEGHAWLMELHFIT